ncbi:hypothetical protein NQ317_008132 [Molorchus minor]|uniref:G-protein coupled receptors family 2 profile 2 domain-containing protein n=1 Tax=Molorchus minor TaxID=1323400 RepID=A0ABQ9IYH2_9CUCU|nr:hypothetical protein NQ317_008132 [Molorchus minor]
MYSYKDPNYNGTVRSRKFRLDFQSNIHCFSKPWCIALHTILYTCLISNYSWMLCEGLYLHTVLVWAFISQSNLLVGMMIIGWGIPLVTTMIYVPVRSIMGEGEELEIGAGKSKALSFTNLRRGKVPKKKSDTAVNPVIIWQGKLAPVHMKLCMVLYVRAKDKEKAFQV